MGIQSTSYITREQAISRIKEIATLLKEQNYREVKSRSFDPHVNMLEFVENWKPINVFGLDNWTDEMLGDYMDYPFFRHSMFDNYLIGGEDDD